MLEIICPILLVLVGCLVVQIDIFEDSKPILCNNDSLASFGKQVIYYGDIDNNNAIYNTQFKFEYTNVTTEFLSTQTVPASLTRAKDGLKYFIEKLYEKGKDGSLNNFGALYTIKANFGTNQFDVVEVINGRARQSPMMYAYVFINQILKGCGIGLWD